MNTNQSKSVIKVVSNGNALGTDQTSIVVSTGTSGLSARSPSNLSQSFSNEFEFPSLCESSTLCPEVSRFALGQQGRAPKASLSKSRRYPVTKCLQGATRPTRKKISDRAAAGFESLKVLEGSVCGKGELVHRKFTRTYGNLVTSTSVEGGLALLKRESAVARSNWVLKGASTKSAQLSYVGRSLPRGSALQSDDALRLHAVDLSTEFKTSSDILCSARKFARGWARRNCLRSTRMAAPDVPTLSASSETTVRGGGLRGLAMRLGLHPEALLLWDDQSLSKLITPQEIQNLVTDASLLYHGRDLCRAFSGLPENHVICLRERGLKTRVITKSPAGLHFVGHVVRKRLLAGLRRDRSSSSPLQGVDDTVLMNSYIGARAEVCVSTDLTRASDLLPLDLVSSIVEGLISSGMFTNIESEALRLLLGPQRINYPPHLGIDPFDSKRGILMGLPVTWAILSIIHLFWWDEAMCSSARKLNVSYKETRLRNRFSICGDDALFIGTKAVAERYKEIVSLCGGQVSPGKHFECDGVGIPLRGVFLERLYNFVVVDGLVAEGGTRCAAIPLRGFVSCEAPDDLRELGSSVSLSNNLKLLYAFDSVWRQHPAGTVMLTNLVEHRFPHLYRFASDLGLVNGLPLKYGGSGLPIRGELSAFALKHKARAILSLEAGVSLPTLLRGVVSSLWQMCTDLATFDINQYFDEGINIQLRFSDPPPPPVDGAEYVRVSTREELMKFAIANSYSNNLYSLGDSLARPRLRDSAVRKAVRNWVKALPVLGERTVSDVLNSVGNPDIVWVRRTRGPSMDLLYPPWVSESFASEARLRSRILGATTLR